MFVPTYKKIKISTEYITLGQFLKFANIISSGAEAKFFIQENDIKLNDVKVIERGKKLRAGDKIDINDSLFFEIVK